MMRILSRAFLLVYAALLSTCQTEIVETHDLAGYVVDTSGNGVADIKMEYLGLSNGIVISDVLHAGAYDSATTSSEGMYHFKNGSEELYAHGNGGCSAGPLELTGRIQFGLRIITAAYDTILAVVYFDSLEVLHFPEVTDQADTVFIGYDIISLDSDPRMMPDIVLPAIGE